MPKILSIRVKKFNEKLSYWWLAAIAYGSAKARTRCQGAVQLALLPKIKPIYTKKTVVKRLRFS